MNTMKNVLEITREAAACAYSAAKESEKALLENLFGVQTFQRDVRERVKSIDDAIKELGPEDPEVIAYQKLQLAGIDNHIKATQALVVIARALNEGWIPDWEDSDQWKYFPWFWMNDSSATGRFSFYLSDTQDSYSTVGSRLCFKSRELSDYAAKQFLDIYKKSLTI